jgi:hypothetical protein
MTPSNESSTRRFDAFQRVSFPPERLSLLKISSWKTWFRKAKVTNEFHNSETGLPNLAHFCISWKYNRSNACLPTCPVDVISGRLEGMWNWITVLIFFGRAVFTSPSKLDIVKPETVLR